MKKSRLFLSLALLAVFAAVLSPGVDAWLILVFPGNSSAFAVAVDHTGDVISAGRLNPYGVVKMSGATGREIWRYTLTDVSFEPSDVAVDASGDVFVSVVGQRFVTKLSGTSGAEIWTKFVGGTGGPSPSVISELKIDRNGDVVTAGSIGGLFNVCKLDGRTGDEIWHYEREGYGMAVAVDQFGDVAAAGTTNQNFGVVKLHGATGLEWWHREINGVGNFSDVFEEANSVAMDSDGSVVAAGITSNIFANPRDFTVAKYSSSGNPLWVHAIDGLWCEINDHGERVCQSNDEAHAVAIGSDGSVFAAGSLQEDATPFIRGANENFHVIKFSRDGDILWSKPAAEPASGEEYLPGQAVSLSVDNAGNVLATGRHNDQFAIVKFIGNGVRDGERLWLRQVGLNGSAGREVSTDADDNVVAAGETPASDGFSIYTVVKLRSTDGGDYLATPSPTPTPTPTPLPDFEGALYRHVPVLRFDSDENYFPLAVESITDNRGNKLVRRLLNEITLAQNPGNKKLPLLNLDFLGDLYPNNTRSLEIDSLYEAQDHEHDARVLQANPYYRDRIYGRVVYGTNPRGNKIAWLQYWFFYYYNDYKVCLAGINVCTNNNKFDNHEGDWEMIQIALASNAEPISVLYAQHEYASQCTWDETEKSPVSNQRPLVFVAKGSHASYFHTGFHPITLVGVSSPFADRADGKGKTLDPLLSVLDDRSLRWLNWPGQWGGTHQIPQIHSPQGPKFQRAKWYNPAAFAADKPFNCF